MALSKYFKCVDALPASTQVVPPETVKAVNEEVKKELGKAGKRGTYPGRRKQILGNMPLRMEWLML